MDALRFQRAGKIVTIEMRVETAVGRGAYVGQRGDSMFREKRNKDFEGMIRVADRKDRVRGCVCLAHVLFPLSMIAAMSLKQSPWYGSPRLMVRKHSYSS